MPHITEMDQNEPRSHQIGQVMQEIGIHDSIENGVGRQYDKEDRRNALAIAVLAGNHLVARNSFDEKYERCDRQDVVVGRERR